MYCTITCCLRKGMLLHQSFLKSRLLSSPLLITRFLSARTFTSFPPELRDELVSRMKLTSLNNNQWNTLLRSHQEVKKADYLQLCDDALNKSENPTEISNVYVSKAHFHSSVGEFQASLPLFEKSLSIEEKVSPKDEKKISNLLNSIGMILFQLEEYEESLKFYSSSLSLREKVLNTSIHPDVAQSKNNIAQVLTATNQFEQAEKLLNESIEILIKCMPNDGNHPIFGTMKNNLAGIYERQNKYELAEVCYRDALRIWKTSFGNENNHNNNAVVANCLNNLAVLLGGQKEKLDEALKLHEEALNIRVSLFTAEHPTVAQSLNNIAVVLDRQGKVPEAELLGKRAFEIRERVLGAEHPLTIQTKKDWCK